MHGLAFFDVEASGLGAGSYPIEVGWTLADGTGGAVLVGHEPWLGFDQGWDPNAEHIHGLSKEHLLAHGLDADRAAEAVRAALAGRVLVSDAPGMDGMWLAELLAEAGAPWQRPPVLDALDLFEAALGDEVAADILWQAERRSGHVHRAQPDSAVLWRVWQGCLATVGPARCAAAVTGLLHRLRPAPAPAPGWRG